MDSHLQNASMNWAMIMEEEILLGDRVLTRQLGKNVVHGAKKITKPQHDLPTTRAYKVVGAKQITQEGTERLATPLGSYVEKFTDQLGLIHSNYFTSTMFRHITRTNTNCN